MVVAVGLVGLEHRELRVVVAVDAFVAEGAAELEDPLDAADEHPLEVELERDPELHRDAERVVVRRERACVRAAGDRLEHRTFELDEPSLVEHTPDRLEHGGACEERGARFLVGDQVQVAASLLQIGVLQAGPLLREPSSASPIA